VLELELEQVSALALAQAQVLAHLQREYRILYKI
jgi:hypothetical protein